VKQIVGGSLTDRGADTNHVSEHSADYFAELYRHHQLDGGHVIALGPGNEVAAKAALAAWPGGLQFGGGVTPETARGFLDAGACKVIVTSYLFTDQSFSWDRLKTMVASVGTDQLVIDLSCRRTANGWQVATNRWQTVTELAISEATLVKLSQYCSEFLVHAADVEGLQQGIDRELVTLLGQHSPIPTTYAGGARSSDDLRDVAQLSQGKLDLTIGSALDIFGGSGATLAECIHWNRQ
jgi:phosphoribosylformimino-5-aminoimidazole carboxamide ribotide isomerase